MALPGHADVLVAPLELGNMGGKSHQGGRGGRRAGARGTRCSAGRGGRRGPRGRGRRRHPTPVAGAVHQGCRADQLV
eukprot:376407-Alexandrium_andersonii.AAC.1